MDNTFLSEFIFPLVSAVTIQIIGVFGIFFVFGFLLSMFQQQTQNLYQRTVGWKGILWTAWLGTPIHELSHALMAKLFMHRVTSISLFKPNKRTGGLGHVDHTYHKWNLWARIGNFFIGAAPMIFGSLVLYLLFRFLLPGTTFLDLPLYTDSSLSLIFSTIKQTLSGLLTLSSFSTWQFWLFLYLSFCVASHLAPSRQDQKVMIHGFLWLLVVLLLINIAAILIGVNITDFIVSTNHFLGIFIALFTYALIISLIHFIIVFILSIPFRR
ncbi:MAG: hypothetical protein HN726_03880 [Candidatus Magasanikbacteria bacterium]|jgi:hypothetical protein|nr:hypothetical protein [Candidatus Magasanikbacteria bacterium]MBT4221275.1 hypothetical protein [Candidatus Magasanikbacteria bacterium]MBT4350421.1 hypothetical protein [Candidatus Magasanikbacteria bacterium]MBT4542032.1 hypothetical protein [Candidatus Magasanikbacteria bacterium]MBT6253399.1 hypothetical protein [Candidatus Magasanikbacteria bacterium]